LIRTHFRVVSIPKVGVTPFPEKSAKFFIKYFKKIQIVSLRVVKAGNF